MFTYAFNNYALAFCFTRCREYCPGPDILDYNTFTVGLFILSPLPPKMKAYHGELGSPDLGRMVINLSIHENFSWRLWAADVRGSY